MQAQIQFSALTDEEVMQKFQSGYDRAFDVLVKRYQNRIHNFLYRYTHNDLDAEDLTQETFYRLYRCRNSYECIAKFSTWLYTIANNLARSHYKKTSRMPSVSIQTGYETDGEEHEIELSDYNNIPDDVVQSSMNMELLEKALNKLPAEFKEMIVLRDIQNLTYEEIEQITGLAMGTVKSRINRGRVRLQKMLGKLITPETLSA